MSLKPLIGFGKGSALKSFADCFLQYLQIMGVSSQTLLPLKLHQTLALNVQKSFTHVRIHQLISLKLNAIMSTFDELLIKAIASTTSHKHKLTL